MPALYRTYRPKNFSEVVGQAHIVRTLQNAVKNGTVAHAYLFCGSRGVGKTTLARVLARALNCTKQKNGESCLTCENCVAFDRGTFLDLLEIDAASHTGVDNIRDLIEHSRFAPTQGKYKVCIIDEVHMLSKGAFNALLKTLEEPPEHLLFILATTENAKIPATIISRTQRFDFEKLSYELIRSHLASIAKKEKLKIEEGILDMVTRLAEGGMRDALTTLDKLVSMGSVTLEEARAFLGVADTQLLHEFLKHIIGGESGKIPSFVDALSTSGVDLAVFTKDFLEYLRIGLVYKVAAQAPHGSYNQQDIADVAVLLERVTAADIMYTIRLFLRSFKETSSAPSPDLPLLLAGVEAALKFNISVSTGGSAPVVRSSQAPLEPVRQEMPPLPKKAPTTPLATESVVRETAASAAPVITFAELQEAWIRICDHLRNVNGPLATLVKNSPLLEMEAETAFLAVKYIFHKEHLESVKNAQLLADAVVTVTGKRAVFRGRIVKTESSSDGTSKDERALADALQVFGGELVG